LRGEFPVAHDTIVFTFAFAPSAPGTVFAGTCASGVYRSTDAGQSRVRITSGIDIGSFYSVTRRLARAVARHVARGARLRRPLLSWVPIIETGQVAERLRVREIDDDEGRRAQPYDQH